MHVFTFACFSPPDGLSSRFRLRGRKEPRPCTTAHVWAPAEFRGACSGRPKFGELVPFQGLRSVEPSRAIFFVLVCFNRHFYFPAQLVGRFTLSDLLDKPWLQVSSLLPPVRAFILIAHKVQHSHCSSIFIECC